MPVFRIPGPLRTLSGGEPTVSVEAGDLRSAIAQRAGDAVNLAGRTTARNVRAGGSAGSSAQLGQVSNVVRVAAMQRIRDGAGADPGRR